MKFAALIVFIMTSFLTQAQSFDCYLKVGNNPAQKLIQTAFAEDDPEEEFEEYQLNLASGIKAYVMYLRYQDGLDLFLEKGDVSVNATFDQEEDDYANLDLEIGEAEYRLYCTKN